MREEKELHEELEHSEARIIQKLGELRKHKEGFLYFASQVEYCVGVRDALLWALGEELTLDVNLTEKRYKEKLEGENKE